MTNSKWEGKKEEEGGEGESPLSINVDSLSAKNHHPGVRGGGRKKKKKKRGGGEKEGCKRFEGY